jgi:hypothetical protein
MNTQGQNLQNLTTPLKSSLDRLSLTTPLPVPEVVSLHRISNPVPAIGELSFNRDFACWNKIDRVKREVLVHVISRFSRGMELAKAAIPTLERAASKAGRKNGEIYRSIENDMDYLGRECRRYLCQVANTWTLDPKAVNSPNFERIFNYRLSNQIDNLQRLIALDDNQQVAKERIQAETKLRLTLHIIAEGLGGITGVWGLNAALRELKGNSKDTGVDLRDLADLMGVITLVLRRNIAFGLSEWRELATKSWWSTMRPAIGEFREVKPILDAMREETFSRWEEFPFQSIDKALLAAAGRKRVLSWIGDNLLTAGVLRWERKVASLEEIL